MSNARVHAIRSHRSKRSYKPVYKALCHSAVKERKRIRKFNNLVARGKDAFDRLLPRREK